MGLKYYSEEVNNSYEFSPLYANTSALYDKRNQYPFQLSTGTSTVLQKNIYANISTLPSESSDDTSYTTLINTKSITSISKTDIILDENNNYRIYENINLQPPNFSSISPLYMNIELDKNRPTSSQNEQTLNSLDNETNILEINATETTKKLEINMAPNCGDKSILYRTKLPTHIRRTSHRTRRNRRRNSTHIRTNHHRRQQQQRNSQMKSVSNRLYNEIHQPILSTNPSEGIELFEYPIGYHGILQHQIIAWYPTEEGFIPQVFSASENGESNQQEAMPNEEEEDEGETEVEELLPHDTFEDFLLRRPRKSSSSSSSSDTNTIISEKPPVQSRDSPRTALKLDKKDVDFVRNIIQRTHGNDRESNRITALREAYLRAENKRNDFKKTLNKKMPNKPSFVTSKIRHELEKYDELPIHQRAFLKDDDSDDDEDTYSANDDHRFHRQNNRRVPSTTHRIINFLSTLKRQLQKNFQDIRSRILIETMENPSTRHAHQFHGSSGLSHRHTSRPKTPHKTNTHHHPIENSHSNRRQQLYRAHSNTSRLDSHRPRTFRVTADQQRWQRMP